MKWVSVISTEVSLELAIKDIAHQVGRELGDQPIDLGLLFVSASFASEYARVLPILHGHLDIKHLLGCSGGGIIGAGRELEEEPAIAFMGGILPETHIHLFHCVSADLPDPDSAPDRWYQLVGVSPQSKAGFILLGDGFSFAINDFLQGMDFAYGNAAKVGGLASGNATALFLNQNLHRQGLVGVAIWGMIALTPIVAQGCRPIGEIMQVSQADRNLILALDNQRPLTLLQKIVDDLSEADRQLVQNSLFIGLVMDEFQLVPRQGDFLIRNIIGVDPRSGAIAIGDRVRAGQRVQLHVRDSQASAEDLHHNLELFKIPRPMLEGAVMFSCLGRGQRLYGQPNFDTQVFQEYFGSLPLGGFFCNGEIGPVGGTTFLHGYTSVFAIFMEVMPPDIF